MSEKSDSPVYLIKKRMRDGTEKVYVCNRSNLRRSLNLTFSEPSEMTAFDDLIKQAKAVNRCDSLSAVIIKALRRFLETRNSEERSSNAVCNTPKPLHQEAESRAITPDPVGDPCLVVCDKAALWNVIQTVEKHSSECKESLILEKVTAWGFASRIHCKCINHSLVLNTSTVVGSVRAVDCLLTVAYASSGVLATQFEKFCNFSKLPYSPRTVEKLLVDIEGAVELLKLESLAAAQEGESRATEQHDPTSTAISVETDARHACRKNSTHTDVVALGQMTHKVVGIVHVSKKDELSSQKHEAFGTKKLYEYFDSKKISVLDHAHDRNTTVNKIIREKNGPSNSNDRWHAAKSLKKGFLAISSGPKRNEGKTWHVELSDKCQAVRNHAYYAMAACEGNPTKLRDIFINCVNHFEGKHEKCSEESICKENGHVPTTLLVKDPLASELLTKFLKSTTIYKNAEDYVKSKDTFYVESFNNTMLIYLQKRIHYQDRSYKLRQSLALLDWNEHVGRGYTSRYSIEDCRHPDRQGGKRKYFRKTYSFVQKIRELVLRSAALGDASTVNDDSLVNDESV
ncbi:uncharacterized protein LOC115320344 [Ixodes scapularis]|uniref:uncharacterized protein LOC115320344 n=2 Tax=Ixodes scapularis TaxID=6945 RepID=UPI001A9D23AF|nr:uncharacterized protein LOC115320344 [Ixodes scapularis]